MKIAIIGISGRVGRRIAVELLQRGHSVTGISRSASGDRFPKSVRYLKVDANDPEALAPALAGQVAVVSASRFLTSNADSLIQAVRLAGMPRLLVVGGAGSMDIVPGTMLYDTPEFPEKSKPESGAGIDFLQRIRTLTDIDWTFLSPSALFDPVGPRTGKFRLGQDTLLMDEKGKSWISMDDYAIAMANEIETPRHSRQRFTVGY